MMPAQPAPCDHASNLGAHNDAKVLRVMESRKNTGYIDMGDKTVIGLVFGLPIGILILGLFVLLLQLLMRKRAAAETVKISK